MERQKLRHNHADAGSREPTVTDWYPTWLRRRQHGARLEIHTVWVGGHHPESRR